MTGMGQDVVVERAQPFSSGLLREVLAGLQDYFLLNDDDLDDDLELVLGVASGELTGEEAERLIPGLRRTLHQVVAVAVRRADGAPSGELAAVIDRARCFDAHTPRAASGPSARGDVRRLALTVLDLLDLLATEDDVSSADFSASPPGPGSFLSW